MNQIADNVRNALWEACKLTNCITDDKGLEDPLFLEPAATFVAGTKGIHAGLVGLSEHGIIAAVKGTDMDNSMLDVLNDLLCVGLHDFKGRGRVHEGFYLAYNALVKAGMLQTIRELVADNPDKRLYLTGHSKGGAVATLLATDFEADPKKTNVVTFASPHVGEEHFRRNYNYAHWRYESFMDLVPHLAPTKQEYTLLKTAGCLINFLSYIIGEIPSLDYIMGKIPCLNYVPVGELVNFYVRREECRAYGDDIPHEQHNRESETLTSLYAIEWMALNRLFHGKSQAEISQFDFIGLLNLLNDMHNNDYDDMICNRNTVFY